KRLLEGEGARQVGPVPQVLDRRVDLHGVRDRGRAGLGDEELAHLLLAAFHRVGDAQERARALVTRRAGPRPLVEGTARGPDGAADVVQASIWRVTDLLLRGRIRHRVRRATRRRSPLAID